MCIGYMSCGLWLLHDRAELQQLRGDCIINITDSTAVVWEQTRTMPHGYHLLQAQVARYALRRKQRDRRIMCLVPVVYPCISIYHDVTRAKRWTERAIEISCVQTAT